MLVTKNVQIGIKAAILLVILNFSSINTVKALTGCSNCREADSLALVALYNATDGPNWTNHTNWLVAGKPISTWYGITKISLNRVKTLELSDNGLIGHIPDSLGYLTKLNNLYLQKNSLEGSIPASIAKMTNINTIYLNNNLLSGPLPSSFANLIYLEFLHIFNNKFTISNIISSSIPATNSNFFYAPQSNIPAPDVIANGNEFTLTAGDIRSDNHYVWYVNDVKIEGIDSSSYTIKPTEICSVYVEIRNETYTIQENYSKRLILQSEPVVLTPVEEEDTTPPVALAKSISVLLDENGSVSITSSQIDNGSWDESGIESMTVAPSLFNCSNIGGNLVTLTVTDKNSNVSTDEATVTVEDKIAPVVNTQSITVQLDELGKSLVSVEDVNTGSNDNCGIASMLISQSGFDCSNIGENVDTLIVTDVNGNVSRGTFSVTVEDKIAPVVNTQSITVQLDELGKGLVSVEDVNTGSTDNCGIASMLISQSGFDCSNIGENVDTLIVTDVNGNVSRGTFSVTVEDKIAPVVNTQSITVQLDELGKGLVSVEDVNTGSTDNCGIASMLISQSGFDCSNIGENADTLIVTDVNGNVSRGTFSVTVEDKIAPVVNTQNVTIQLDELGKGLVSVEDVNTGSTDNCGIASMLISQSGYDCSNIGENVDTLIVTDVNGNVSRGTFVVTVEDKIAPVVNTQNTIIQLDATGNAVITAAMIDNGSSDACGISSVQISKSVFNCNNLGDNAVTLTITDATGNVSSEDAVVKVQDLIAPTIIAPASVSIMIQPGTGGVVVDLGQPVVSDNCEVNAPTNDAPVLFTEGVTAVTWTVTDKSGNSSTATQEVEITVDQTANNEIPVIISITSNSPVYLSNAAMVTAVFSDDNLKSATWYWGDESTTNGNILGNQVFGTHIYSETGLYNVTLTIVDAFGKTDTKVYSYIVVFDSGCGDVTGGGWINSNKGDYLLKRTCDKGNFGFVAQYDKKRNVKGNFTYHLNNSCFKLKSTSIDWLLIDYDHAIFKGKADVNGHSGYEFLVSTVDADMQKRCRKIDLLRIIVWDRQGNLIYDNQQGSGITERPANPITQGSIVIHSTKQSICGNFKSTEISEEPEEILETSLFDNLKVYPNPATNVLNIEIPGREEQAINFDIIDVTGRIITHNFNLDLWGQNSWIELEQFHMSPGFYFLKLKDINGEESSVLRFMKK